MITTYLGPNYESDEWFYCATQVRKLDQMDPVTTKDDLIEKDKVLSTTQKYPGRGTTTTLLTTKYEDRFNI